MLSNFKTETDKIVRENKSEIAKYYIWNTELGVVFEGSGKIKWPVISNYINSKTNKFNPYLYDKFVDSKEPFVGTEVTDAITWAGYIYFKDGNSFKRGVELYTEGCSSIETWIPWKSYYQGDECLFKIYDKEPIRRKKC